LTTTRAPRQGTRCVQGKQREKKKTGRNGVWCQELVSKLETNNEMGGGKWGSKLGKLRKEPIVW